MKLSKAYLKAEAKERKHKNMSKKELKHEKKETKSHEKKEHKPGDRINKFYKLNAKDVAIRGLI